MIFETIRSDGLAHFSYLLGDEEAGVCAVIDPRRDVQIYLDLARQHDVHIAYILETHIHADFVSGSRELAARCGAPICVGEGGDYGFAHRGLADGDTLTVGAYSLQARHTPGHTPEHVCYLVSGGSDGEAPWGLFSGDTLFAGEVGRPDLLGDGTEEKLARQLFTSLHEKVLPLGDQILLFPAHGEGSPCGADIGGRPISTLGYERQHNPLLHIQEEAAFVRQVLGPLTPAPGYYPRMKQINAAGPPLLGTLPYWKPLTPQAFRREMEAANTVVVDGRAVEAFAGAHIAGAIHIGLRPSFPIWAGRILAPQQRLLLVLANPAQAETVQRHLLRVGYTHLVGYLHQGLRSWLEAGLPFQQTGVMSVHDLKRRIDAGETPGSLQLLDVRDDNEWQEGHIPGAQHIFVPDLVDNLDRLDREIPLAVYCDSGYRASIAASLLQRHGFQQVHTVPGSISAWTAAGYATETP